MSSPTPLTKRQDLFAREYVIDLNATQAALRAGYSPTTAKANCAQLLAHPGISARIDELMSDRVDRAAISADEVLARLASIADEAQEEGSWQAALRALELLGRHLGLWKSRHETTVSVSGNPFATGLEPEALRRDVARLMLIARITPEGGK